MLLICFVIFCSIFTGGYFIGKYYEKDRIFDLSDKGFVIYTHKKKKYKITEWDDSIFDKNIKNK
jgi:hypothetical protein